jgi:ureidoglycolate lyase
MHSPSFSSTASAAVSINSGLVLAAQPLTPAAFAPFGQVVAVDGQAATLPQRSINSGNARRYDLLADLQLTADGGVPTLALFRAEARQFPLQVVEMERHAWAARPLFRWARSALWWSWPVRARHRRQPIYMLSSPMAARVVLAPGTWHHALLAVEGGDFAVVERRAAQVDCDVCGVDPALTVALLQ